MSQEKREPAPDDERIWEVGWEGHELAQLKRLAKLTFAQKLQWLEEAHRLVRQLEKSSDCSSRKNGPDAKGPIGE